MSGPDVIFTDPVPVARKVLQDGFTALGDSMVVTTKTPKPRPSRFIRVVRAGGVPNTAVSDKAMLVIETNGSDYETATVDAMKAQAILRKARHTVVDGVTVYVVNVAGGPVDAQDPVTEDPRVDQRIEFATRGTDF